MTKFYSIQVLRAVAAIAVILYHESLLNIGEAGVDIFFVISGFVMGTVGVKESPGDFMCRRIIRIVPLYWAITLAMCAASLIPGLFSHFTFTATQLIESLLFVPYYDAHGHIWPLLVQGWTLNYELFFYGIFTVSLALHRPVFLSILLLLACVVTGQLLKTHHPVLLTWTNPLLLEFIAGLLLAKLRLPYGWGIVLLVTGAIIFIYLSITNGSYTDIRVIAFGIPALCVTAGAITMERFGHWPRLKIVEAIGDASYSLYLLHGLVVSFIHKNVHANIFTENTVILLASLGIAQISYQLIERPATLFFKAKINGPQ